LFFLILLVTIKDTKNAKIGSFFSLPYLMLQNEKKMKFRGLYLLLPLFVFAIACSKPKEIEFKSFENVSMKNGDFNKPIISFDTKIFNPNSYPVTVKNVACVVKVNDQLIGNCKIEQAVKMPAKQQSLVPVVLYLEDVKSLTQLMVAALNSEVKISIDGNGRVGRSGIYFSAPIKYETKQSLADFKLF